MKNVDIFKPLSSEPSIKEQKYYCCSGKEDFIDEDGYPRSENENNTEVVAKALSNKKPKHFNDKIAHYRFYIKMSPDKQPFNPVELHSSLKDKSTFINQTCKGTWIFKEVDKSVFDLYLKFLKSKNQKYLKDIGRQLK